MPLVGTKEHRCYDHDENKMCKYFTTTHAPDCDSMCVISGDIFYDYYLELPQKCPFRMKDGILVKKLIDKELKHYDKSPSGIMYFKKVK